MSMFWHCSYCWDDPCTCSPEEKEQHRQLDAAREAQWQAAYQALTPAQQRAFWATSIEVTLPPVDTSAMEALGRAAGASVNEAIQKVLRARSR